MRLCLCGCGRHVKGRADKRYAAPRCRKLVSRRRRSHLQIQHSKGGVRRPGDGKLDTKCVTPTDTKVEKASVHCSGCGKNLPRVIGPLPCLAYCRDCVEEGLCPCSRRPSWHSKLQGARRN